MRSADLLFGHTLLKGPGSTIERSWQSILTKNLKTDTRDGELYEHTF